MNEQSASAPAPAGATPDGVRTYRGRTIEELIPRIRSELGPDAIILREREGLTGGIGGFFAQRCVEIDARAAARVNIYDEDYDDEEEGYAADAEEYEDGGAEAAEPYPERVEPAACAPPASAPFLDEASFAARLEEATFAPEALPGSAPSLSPSPSPSPEPAADGPLAPAPTTPAFIAFDELGDAGPGSEAATARAAEAAPAAEAPAAEPAPSPPSAPRIPLEPAPWLTFAAQPVTAPAASPPVQAPPATGAPAPTMPAPALAVPVPAHAPVPAPPAGAPAPYGHGVRRRGGLLPAAERLLRAALDAATVANERRELGHQARLAARPAPAPAAPHAAPAAPRAAPAVPAVLHPEPAAPVPAPAPGEQDGSEQQRRDAEIERRLVAGGLSPSRATALVEAAISTRGPLNAGRELVADVRATIGTSLPAPHALPAGRGAVAIVGAGGSGKTRCVAAIAASRARAGGLVSVASLGAPGHEDELGRLLHGEPVNVIPAMRTRATARAVSSARERGLVVIDTAAVTPSDGSTIDVIAEALRSFELDAIYLAVPATLSSSAGARLIGGFSAFDLTGLVATHVDETDQLGVIAELSMLTGIPLSATHTGLDLQNAITAADPDQIAAELLR